MEGKFIDVTPQIGDRISAFVSRVSKDAKNNPETILWYHGEAVWFVQKKEEMSDQTIIRRVQITPYWYPSEGERLYFVPQLFSILKKEPDSVRTFKEIKSENIKYMSLEKFADRPYEEFKEHVLACWNIALDYDVGKLDQQIPRFNDNISR